LPKLKKSTKFSCLGERLRFFLASSDEQLAGHQESSASTQKSSYRTRLAPAAKEVDTILKGRIIKVRKKRFTVVHTILGVSGGVQVDFSETVAAEMIQVATREEMATVRFRDCPVDPNRWWWN
jgi:hypothetical protein